MCMLRVYMRACVCTCIVGKNARRTSASFLARRQVRTRNDANHVHVMEIIDFYLYSDGTISKEDTRVWRDSETRARREKADYIFPTRYSSNRFLSLSLSSPPPPPSLPPLSRSSLAIFLPHIPSFALPIAIRTAIHAWRTVRPSGNPSKVEPPRVVTDFLLLPGRVTLQTFSFNPSFVCLLFFTFDC